MPSIIATTSAIRTRLTRRRRPMRVLPCSMVAGRSMLRTVARRLSAVPDRNGQPGGACAPEFPTRRLRLPPVVEQAVDDRACAAHVGAEGAEPPQLVGERRRGEVVRR